MGADTHVDAGGATPPRTHPADPTPTQKPCVFVGIGGMTCGGCAARVQESMAALEGVAAVEVDLSAMRATVFAADENTELAALRDRAEGCIRSLGYEVLPGPAAPVTDAAATSMTPPSSLSSSSCCLPALRRNSLTVSPLPPSAPAADCRVPPPPSGLDSAVEAAAAPPPRQRSSALFPVRRFRRGPCGCGGRGCLCAIVPVQEMMTEETRLLGGADDGAAATIPSYDAAVVVEVGTHKKRKAAAATAAAGGAGMAAVPPATATARTTLLIEGMSCTSCAARIEMALQRVAGVESASVNFSTMSGFVLHNTARASLERVVGCVADLGFTVTTQSTTAKFATAEEESCGECCCSTNLRAIPLRAGDIASCYEHRILVKGMSCASCAARIEAAVCQLPQVLSCTVSFATGTAVVNTRTASGYLEVCEVLESMGYTATDMASVEPEASLNRTRDALERTREIAEHERNLIGSALLSLPLAGVMLLMMFTSVMEEHMTLARVLDGVQLCATTPIVFYYGRSFFTNAWRSFQHGAYTMDTLVALGTGCTYVYSVVVYMLALLVFPHAHMMTYFDTAGMLTTFMLLGRFLEAKAKRSTSGALIELMTLVPTTALCVRPDGTEVRVSTAELEKGAMVRVLAGDRVPVDGVIVDGSSELDEQMITGESLPKYKKPGESVVGGTLNITATLLIQADKVGAETMMAQVLRIVQEAQNTKPAVQRVADRIAMYFVPFVLSLSLATLAVWLVLGATHAYPDTWREHGTTWQAFAFNFFISTVVAACPCALGLATPTAVMVGTGVGAKNGVLVKSGSTLEAVRKVDCVVLDKTGTLTKGQLEVVGTDTTTAATLPHGVDAAMARRLVGLVEAQSNHPIAKAVSERLLGERGSGSPCAARPPPQQQQQHLRYEVGAVVTHGGKGLEACVTVRKEDDDDSASAAAVQHRLLVGNLALLQSHGVEPSADLLEKMRAANGRGLTTVLAAIDGVACVLVSLADEPKREARGVVQHLRKGGVRVLMVTGDNAGVATRIAAEVGIAPADVHAEALPTAKAEIVQELQRSGLRVMFVGDGINDSPALAQANVGVALGAGTEVAIEAADAVLVRNSLVDLLNLRSLSTTTVRRIYGNFVWAFGYNLLMLPVASGLLFPLLHRQLPPVLAGAAMMLSSLSVLTSSLSIRCFRPYRERDFYHD